MIYKKIAFSKTGFSTTSEMGVSRITVKENPLQGGYTFYLTRLHEGVIPPNQRKYFCFHRIFFGRSYTRVLFNMCGSGANILSLGINELVKRNGLK